MCKIGCYLFKGAESIEMNYKNQGPSRSILIVDDDRLILATLSQGLRQAGYVVFQASSGKEALQLAMMHTPELALLDVTMPVMSGIELAQRLREDFKIPFLFLSAYGDSDIVHQAAELGALGYLVKPVDTPQIIPAIEAALARAAEIQRLQRAETDLSVALSIGRDTNIAVGLLMEQRRLSRADAFELLRRHARGQQRKIHEVAGELIQASETLNMVRRESAMSRGSDKS